jgi:hypothetical protein
MKHVIVRTTDGRFLSRATRIASIPHKPDWTRLRGFAAELEQPAAEDFAKQLREHGTPVSVEFGRL